MNKIKLLYDVVMTMKDKEVFKGTLAAEGFKDGEKKFSFNNEFEKGNLNGTRAKISAEVDCNGKKMKHESTSEFSSGDCHKNMYPGFMNHFHSFHTQMHCNSDEKCCGIKEKLTAFAFALHIFNSIKVDEGADKGFNLSLKLNDIPEDLKKIICEKMKQKENCCCDKHFECLKEFHCTTEHNADITVLINKNYEVEKVTFTADGKQTDEKNTVHEMNAKAELNLIW